MLLLLLPTRSRITLGLSVWCAGQELIYVLYILMYIMPYIITLIIYINYL